METNLKVIIPAINLNEQTNLKVVIPVINLNETSDEEQFL
jgi:hypothetical protein